MPIKLNEAEAIAKEQGLLNKTREEKAYKDNVLPLICQEIDKKISDKIKYEGFKKETFEVTICSVYPKNSFSNNLLTETLVKKIKDRSSFEYRELANLYPEWDIQGKSYTTEESNREDWPRPETYSTCYHNEIVVRVKM